MAKGKKPQAKKGSANSSNPSYVGNGGFATVDENGKVPDSRVPTSNDAFIICEQLRVDNAKREIKWSRIFRCYNLFPPNSYSKVAAAELQVASNVAFGQMKYRVDNKKSPFFDMVMQRNQAANIVTKKGNDDEKKRWSDLISTGWDMTLRRSPFYRYNTELTIQEMLLYGKGFEFADNMDGWPTTSLHNYNVLIPEDTYADLSNLGEICLKRSYTPIEFWRKIKNKEYAKQAGWNFWACVDAIRYFSGNYQYYKSLTEFMHAVDSQSTVLNRVYNLKINVYELYVMEYDGSITKTVTLQNYAPISTALTKDKKGDNAQIEEDYRSETGYLFVKQNYAEKWSDLITPFTCSAGSGFWHEIKGFAEGIYSQCRAHDIHMNKLMTALLINNTFMMEGGSPEATKTLKKMEWTMGGLTILPSDTRPVQNRWEMPTTETMQVMQYYTSEMDRGTGTYQINAPTNKGGQRTAAEAQADVAESSKLQGTEVRGYNDSQSKWQNMLYKRMCNTTRGGEGYELFQFFKQYMTDNGVPKEAWQYENLESLESNLLGGAASPSFKLMAADKLIVYAGMTASSPGQENAIQDAIAACADRQNVARYRPVDHPQIPKEAWQIGMENAALTDPRCNPENVKVRPTDNHVEHFKGHFSDAMSIGKNVQAALQQQAIQPEDMMDAHKALLFHGGHMTVHLDLIKKDPTKKEITQQFDQAFGVLQKLTDEIGKNGQQAMEAKQKESQNGQTGDPSSDIKIQEAAALSGIRVDEAQKLSDIKIGGTSAKAAQQIQSGQEKTANSIAESRAKTDAQIENDKRKTAHTVALKTGEAVHDAALKQADHEQDQHITEQEAIQQQQIDAEAAQGESDGE
jgi:hypothetical protein